MADEDPGGWGRVHDADKAAVGERGGVESDGGVARESVGGFVHRLTPDHCAVSHNSTVAPEAALPVNVTGEATVAPSVG
jgi:hypothetical protein